MEEKLKLDAQEDEAEKAGMVAKLKKYEAKEKAEKEKKEQEEKAERERIE